MYKKPLCFLLVGNLVFLLGFACVREAQAAKLVSQPVAMLHLELEELERKAWEREQAYLKEGVSEEAVWAGRLGDETIEAGEYEENKVLGIAQVAVSGQRIVDYRVVEQSLKYDLPDSELEVLLRIVEAEAGGEDEDGKLLVANVVLNRVNSDKFPDTVADVVFQEKNGVVQFSPVANGSYEKVKISEGTIKAVSRALMGEDISEGALYFAARKYADNEKMKWFDYNLDFLFCHGGHEFFK